MLYYMIVLNASEYKRYVDSTRRLYFIFINVNCEENIMMFTFHAAFFLGLLALSAGLSFYIWTLRKPGAGTALAKVFGLIIIIASVSGILCLSYYAISYWHQGYFKTPMGMPMMQDKSMSGMDMQMMQSNSMGGGMGHMGKGMSQGQ